MIKGEYAYIKDITCDCMEVFMKDNKPFRIDPSKCHFTKRELIDDTVTHINKQGEIIQRKHNSKKPQENKK